MARCAAFGYRSGMQLPGRLSATTLGDVLGALHRERASGALEIVERTGRIHRVHVAAGLVSAVELDRSSPSLADVLRPGPPGPRNKGAWTFHSPTVRPARARPGPDTARGLA